MHRSSLAIATLGFAAASAAQAGFHYSPRGLGSAEGDYSSYHLGRYPAMRMQAIDGELRGQTGSIREIALRLDHRNFTSTSGMGRKWSSVSIRIADGDLRTFSADYSNNTTSTPTTVFSAAVTWPTVSGTPLTKPDLWGGVTGAYRVPFTAAWSYGGRTDIVTDWSFAGGSLTNSATWSSSMPHDYHLDGFGDPSAIVHGTYQWVPPTRLNNNSAGVTGRCNDSAFGSTATGAYSAIYGSVYPLHYDNVDWRNKLVIYSYSYFTAFEAPVIHAWSVRTDTTGVELNTGCNRLHAIGPYVLFQTFAIPPRLVNATAYSGFRYLVEPWTPGLANARLCMQAAWADSTTGYLNLTQAREITLPAAGPATRIPDRAAVYSYGNSGPLGPFGSYEYNMPMRYTL